MKHLISSLLLVLLTTLSIQTVHAAPDLSGRIVLQVHDGGHAWYINPADKRKYYLSSSKRAHNIFYKLSVPITTDDLLNIPTQSQPWDGKKSLMPYVRGRILRAVEDNNALWYVHPDSGKRMPVPEVNTIDAFIHSVGLGVENSTIAALPATITVAHIQPKGKDEYFTLQNKGQIDQPLTYWSIHNGKEMFSLGHLAPIRAGQSVRIYTRTHKRQLHAQKNIWNNRTGAATLFQKNRTISGYRYGELPQSLTLAVPFTAQAPTGNWSSPFDEACEEASMLMVDAWYHRRIDSSETIEAGIQDVVGWEMAHFGYHEDTSTHDMARLARERFGYEPHIKTDPSAEYIKRRIVAGEPVIVPVYGRALANPHYKAPGPLYHVVLIVGYDANDFIVHDPGTRYGAFFRYSIPTVMNAMHDLTHPESAIASGTPMVLTLEGGQ